MWQTLHLATDAKPLGGTPARSPKPLWAGSGAGKERSKLFSQSENSQANKKLTLSACQWILLLQSSASILSCAVLQATVRWVLMSCFFLPWSSAGDGTLSRSPTSWVGAGPGRPEQCWSLRDLTISCRRRHFSCRISCNNERRGNRTVSDNPTQQEKTFFQSVTLYNFVAYVEPSWSLLPSVIAADRREAFVGTTMPGLHSAMDGQEGQTRDPVPPGRWISSSHPAGLPIFGCQEDEKRYWQQAVHILRRQNWGGLFFETWKDKSSSLYCRFCFLRLSTPLPVFRSPAARISAASLL